MTKHIVRLLLLMLMMGACKKDFTEVGYDMVNDQKFTFNSYKVQNIKFYSHAVDSVKSIAQPLVGLGVYKQPAYGLTEANLRLTFGTSTDFDSDHFKQADSILFVELRIPYFSEKNEELSTDTEPIYDVDSIYGFFPFDLKVYYNNFYFFPYDPKEGLRKAPSYYSNFDFEPNNGELLYHNHTFLPDLGFFVDTLARASGIDNLDIADDVRTNITNDTVGPMFHIRLDTTFFREKFFDHAGEDILTDPTLFQSYFRGFYLKSEALGDDGTFMLMNPQVYLVLAYRYTFTNDNDTPDDESDDYEDHAYEEILLPGLIHVNTYNNLFYDMVDQQIHTPDVQNGAQKVYIKGDGGSMGMLRLFNSTELYELRNNKWMINEALLRFYVDETEMSDIPDEEQPQQLFIYKYDYRQPISDLNMILDDGTQVDPNSIIATYNGFLFTDSTTMKKYYEFNITRHIKDVLRKDSSNVRLGIRVAPKLNDFLQNINFIVDPDAYVPFGTVVKGNLAAEDPVELIIYYTEPKEEDE